MYVVRLLVMPDFALAQALLLVFAIVPRLGEYSEFVKLIPANIYHTVRQSVSFVVQVLVQI